MGPCRGRAILQVERRRPRRTLLAVVAPLLKTMERPVEPVMGLSMATSVSMVLPLFLSLRRCDREKQCFRPRTD